MPDLVSHYRDAGFSDDEISTHLREKRDQYKAAGFSDAEVDAHFGMPPTPDKVPSALVQRTSIGSMLSKAVGLLPEAISDIPHEMLKTTLDQVESTIDNLIPASFGLPVGTRKPGEESTLESMQKTGEALLGLAMIPFAPLQGALRSIAGHPMVTASDALRRGSIALYGQDRVNKAEEAAGASVGVSPGGMTYEDAKSKVDLAMMLVAPGRALHRVDVGPAGEPEIVQVGGLPNGEDFSTASAAIGRGDTTPAMEAKLGQLYEERGIHPAEVAHDAQTDVTITQSILSSDRGDLPAAYIEAYHASPHDFEAFGPLAEHAGTGEGAAVYGHGYYLSEGLGAHQEYLRDFGGRTIEGGQAIDPTNPAHVAATTLVNPLIKGDRYAAVRYLEQSAERGTKSSPVARAAAKLIEEGAELPKVDAAVSYRVRINANRENMLDWDKPLSEQSPEVQRAVKSLGINDMSMTGEGVHNRLVNHAPRRELTPAETAGIYPAGSRVTATGTATASQALREAGIPGIKYRDQGSRIPYGGVDAAKTELADLRKTIAIVETQTESNTQAGRLSNLRRHEESLVRDIAGAENPTHNFVIFDHNDIEITHKNGEPVTPKEKQDILAAGDVSRGTEGGPTITPFMAAARRAAAGGPPEEPPGPGAPAAAAAGGRPPSYTDAEQQILSRISIGERSPTARTTLNDIYTNFIDRLFPISRAVKKADLADLKAEDNPYNLARLLSGHVGKADHFLNRGTFDFTTYENNGAGLKEILAPVKDDLNGFRAYAAAARALELEGRGIQSGFDTGASSAPPLVSSGLDAARTVVREGRDRFARPFIELVDYQNRVAQYLRDSGVLSDAGYSAMVEANKLYVPFTRVMGINEAAQARGGSSLQATNPVRKIKGSARDIVDPIESVVRNTYHFIEMAEKNQVGTKLVDMLKRAQEELPEAPTAVADAASRDTSRAAAIADALGEVGVRGPDQLADALAHATEPRREGEIAILRDGKRETYSVDPDLARAMKGLDAQSMGLLERVIAFPARTLRAGAVLTPDFQIRHTIRDFLYATTTFKGGIFTPIDMAKGFTGLIMRDADYWDWLKGGGGNISFVGMDRQYLQADLRKLTGETGLVGRAWNVLADPEASMWDRTAAVGKLPFQAIDKFVLDPLRVATAFAESASHLAAFKKTMRIADRDGPEPANLREQIIRAAWESRDTAVDAARMGANMRAYNMITAFANIKLQDTDRVVRAIKDNPIATIAKIGAAITVPSVVLWAANHDDPRYAEIPQWQKDMFFIVMTPDHVFRLPKPWAMGMIFGSGPERLLDAYVAKKPDAFKGFFKDLWQTSGPDFVPTAAAPIIDQFANRSTFTDRTLIPHEQEKFLPEYQYTPYTTELTKALGKMVGAFPGMQQLKMDNSGFGGIARALTSPILMENYIRGWTGTLGTYALQAADAALRKTGKLPDPPLPASTLADIPVIRAFVVRYPTASAESIQNFYDAYEANKKYFDTWVAKAKDGDFAAVQHIQDMGGPMMFSQLDGIKQTLSQHSQIIRDVYKNPTVPPAEKRQLIDQLYFSMIQVGRHGMDAIRDMRRQSEIRTPASAIPEPVDNQPIIVPPIQAPTAAPQRRLGNGSATGAYAPAGPPFP